jgi:hypothetical protein
MFSAPNVEGGQLRHTDEVCADSNFFNGGPDF